MGIVWSISVIALVVLVLVNIRNLINIMPVLFNCLTFWKENVYLQDNISQMRIRNYYSAISVAVIALLALRYDFGVPSFIYGLDAELRPIAVIGVIMIYLGVRELASYITLGRHERRSIFNAAKYCVRNYIILGCVLLLVSLGILSFLGVSESVIKIVFYVEIGLSYFIALVRKTQILASKCSPFITFLYICALEIVPTGLLLAAVAVL